MQSFGDDIGAAAELIPVRKGGDIIPAVIGRSATLVMKNARGLEMGCSGEND
jgi:hypothetical protein